jgi:hypothetical protein
MARSVGNYVNKSLATILPRIVLVPLVSKHKYYVQKTACPIAGYVYGLGRLATREPFG